MERVSVDLARPGAIVASTKAQSNKSLQVSKPRLRVAHVARCIQPLGHPAAS